MVCFGQYRNKYKLIWEKEKTSQGELFFLIPPEMGLINVTSRVPYISLKFFS